MNSNAVNVEGTADASAILDVSDAFWNEVSLRLRQFVQARVSESHTVEDLVQDIVLKAQTGIDGAPIRNFSAWLFEIARNRVIDHYRSAQHRKMSPLDADMVILEAEGDVLKDLSGCLRSMLSRLPESSREVLEQTDLGTLTQAELAQKLGLSLPGAKSRVQRARALLRAEMITCCMPESNSGNEIAEHNCDCGPPDYCEKKTGKC